MVDGRAVGRRPPFVDVDARARWRPAQKVRTKIRCGWVRWESGGRVERSVECGDLQAMESRWSYTKAR